MSPLSPRLKRPFLRWLFHRLPPCEEITRRVSEGMDRPLRLRERFELELHLKICTLCRRYADQLDLLHRAAPELPEHLADQPAGPSLPAATRERLQALLSENAPPEDK